MTVKPIDLQVLIPKAGEVNKVQKGLPHQHQTEQQVVRQVTREEMDRKGHQVNQVPETKHKVVQKEEREKGKRDNHRQEKSPQKQGELEGAKDDSVPEIRDSLGRFLDIKV